MTKENQITAQESKPKMEDLEVLVKLISAHEYDLLEKQAKSLLKNFPKNTILLNFMAFAHMGRKQENEAIGFYNDALKINPSCVNTHNNLGSVHKQKQDYDQAINYFEKAVKINPKHLAANHNLADIYRIQKKWDKALFYFNRISSSNSRAQILECNYFLYGLDVYKKTLVKFFREEPYNLRIAAFATYVSKKDDIKNIYPFCNDPLNYFYKNNLKKELLSKNKFLENLREQLREEPTFWEPASVTTRNGYQSLRNLFDTSNTEILNLKEIIENQINIFKETYKLSEDHLITKWPSKNKIKGWYVKLVQKGFQKSHIHPGGWLSGVFYLKVPDKLKDKEGSLKLSLCGYDYPYDKKLPDLIFAPKNFDIVLFPSSLFHETIPFNSQEERHVIAFDLQPK